MFSFDHDQEVAANAAYEFIKFGKLSLIGQELSAQGIFIGPLHNFIQFIPYSICSLKPDCVPYFYVTLGLITTFIFFLVSKRIISRKVAIIAAGFHAASFVIIGNERGPSSNYFLFLVSTIILFVLYKYLQNQDKFLILGAFLGGLAVVNFNPIFIFTLSAYFLIAVFKKPLKVKIILLSLLAAAINITPLFLFNLRHQNILYHSFLKFITQNQNSENFIERFIFIVKDVLIPYYSNFLFQKNELIYLIITISILLAGSYSIIKSQRKIYKFLPIWILITVAGLTFFPRSIPDYYFVQTLPAFILIISLWLSKRFYAFLFISFLFLFTNINQAINYNPGISYKFKKAITSFVISDSARESFNVYYDFPPGLNTGYKYLFKAYDRIPQEGSKNLYILDFSNPTNFKLKKYYKTFSDKRVNIKTVDSMKIIIVKENKLN